MDDMWDWPFWIAVALYAALFVYLICKRRL